MCLLLLMYPSVTWAQPSTVDQCQTRIETELAKELRRYRAVLFGKKLASEAPVGDIRYDKDGIAWIKTTDSPPWINGKDTGLSWGNTLMDEQDEQSDLFGQDDAGKRTGRRGIFETKRVLTSTLIPYLLQNMRALSCTTDRVCEQVLQSERQESDTSVSLGTIQTIGCIEFPNQQSFKECHLANKGSGAQEQSAVKRYCSETRIQLIQREMALLRLAVEYDAAYRSTLQFAGVFDLFLEEVRWPLMGSIRQAAGLIGQLNRIPCFLSSCDESPPPDNEE